MVAMYVLTVHLWFSHHEPLLLGFTHETRGYGGESNHELMKAVEDIVGCLLWGTYS